MKNSQKTNETNNRKISDSLNHTEIDFRKTSSSLREQPKQKNKHYSKEFEKYYSTVENIDYLLTNTNNRDFMIPFETCKNPLAIQIFKQIVYHPVNKDHLDSELVHPRRITATSSFVKSISLSKNKLESKHSRKDSNFDLNEKDDKIIKKLPKESFLNF